MALLSEALVSRGHAVELLCAPGYSSSATVSPMLDAPHPDSIERALFEVDHVARAFGALDAAASAGTPFDVVHDHCGYTALAMADRIDTPVIHTVHAPFADDNGPFYARHGAKATMVCISHDQAHSAPTAAEVHHVVHNPVDVGCSPGATPKGDWLLWLGRIVPEKGPDRAIQVARAAGRPDAMVRKVERAAALDPRACRRAAARYTPDRAAERYEAIYRHAIAATPAP